MEATFETLFPFGKLSKPFAKEYTPQFNTQMGKMLFKTLAKKGKVMLSDTQDAFFIELPMDIKECRELERSIENLCALSQNTVEDKDILMYICHLMHPYLGKIQTRIVQIKTLEEMQSAGAEIECVQVEDSEYEIKLAKLLPQSSDENKQETMRTNLEVLENSMRKLNTAKIKLLELTKDEMFNAKPSKEENLTSIIEAPQITDVLATKINWNIINHDENSQSGIEGKNKLQWWEKLFDYLTFGQTINKLVATTIFPATEKLVFTNIVKRWEEKIDVFEKKKNIILDYLHETEECQVSKLKRFGGKRENLDQLSDSTEGNCSEDGDSFKQKVELLEMKLIQLYPQTSGVFIPCTRFERNFMSNVEADFDVLCKSTPLESGGEFFILKKLSAEIDSCKTALGIQDVTAGGGGSFNVKIKAIELPLFSGHEQDFFEFFANLNDVLSSCNLNKTAQLAHVKNTCFEKNPKVKAVISNATSLDELFKILHERFGNIHSHSNLMMKKLGNLIKMKKDCSKDVVSFVDNLEIIVRQAKLAQTFHLLTEFSAVNLIKSKLDRCLLSKYAENYSHVGSNSQQEFVQLFEFLKLQRTHAYMLTSYEEMDDSIGVKQTSGPHGRSQKVSVLTTNAKSSKFSCILCSGDHPTFSSFCKQNSKNLTREGWEKLKQSNVCLNCLKTNCKKDCKTGFFSCKERKCNFENRPMNTKICFCCRTQREGPSTPNLSVSKSLVKVKVANLKGQTKNKFGQTVMLCESVMLRDKENILREVVFLYDSGATDSISSKSVSKWGEVQKIAGKLQISGFERSTEVGFNQGFLVKFRLITESSLMEIKAIQVNQLSPVNPCIVQVPHKWRKFFPKEKLELTGNIDLIVGLDRADLFPEKLGEYTVGNETLQLCRSRITGRFLICGRNSKFVDFFGKKSLSIKKMSVLSNDMMLDGANDMPGKHLDAHADENCMDEQLFVDEKCGLPNYCESSTSDKMILNNNDTFYVQEEAEEEEMPKVEKNSKKNSVWNNMEKIFKEQCTVEDLKEDSKSEFEKLKQAEEDRLLLQGINYNDEEKVWYVDYPYNSKLSFLQDNKNSTTKRMHKLQDKLLKKPEVCKLVNNEIKKNIDKGFWKPVERTQVSEDMQKHYIPLGYIFNENSESTPLRIVLDSSSRGSNSISLNHCQIKGSSKIGDLRSCLLKARTVQNLAVGDIEKFYNSFKLSNKDKSLRRILIPKGGFGQETFVLEEFIQDCIPFGDKAAGVLSVMARDKNAQVFKNLLDDEVKEKVLHVYKNQTYVDDVAVGEPWNGDIEAVIKGVEEVGAAGGLSFKPWIKVGEGNPTKYLGYIWNPITDELQLKVKFNLGRVERGKAQENDIDGENIQEILKRKLTKRDALSLMGQWYDPLLILGPIVVKLRLFYASCCSTCQTWEEDIPENLKTKFVSLFKDIERASKFKFIRSVVPRGINCVRPRCELITFCDGSEKAFAAASYIRFKTDEEIICHLLTSAVKICGKRKLTIPRTELLGAEMGVRLCKTIQEETQHELDIISVKYILDSRVVLSQIKKPAGSMDMFCGSRVDFIQNNSIGADWFWCPGDRNPADLSTRDMATYEDVCSPFWMNGGFLMMEEKEWPVIPTHDVQEESVKETIAESVKILIQAIAVEEDKEEDEKFGDLLDKHKNLDKILNIISYIWKWRFIKKSREDPKFRETETQVKRRRRSFTLLIQQSMIKSRNMIKKMKNSDVIIQDNGKVITAKGRNLESMGNQDLLVLDPNAKLSQLLFRHFHEKFGHCSSVKKVQSKLREQFYIPRSTPTLLKIKRNCFTCTKLLAENRTQMMGALPVERFKKSRPFTHIMIDLCGPFKAFDSVKKRVPSKVWGLVVSCCYTRAVWVLALENYSTDSVILGLERLRSRFGNFKTVISDLGTNLIGAAKIDKENQEARRRDIAADYSDQAEVVLEQLEHHFLEVEWKEGVPKAPHVTGAVEAHVKLFKQQMKILERVEGVKKMSFIEYETFFNRLSAIVNERPLVLNAECGTTIKANQLLFGYNWEVGEDAPRQETNLNKRSSVVEENLNLWWKTYNDVMLKNTNKILKWKSIEENLEVNDVVMMLDSPNRVGSYRLGKIIEIFPDQQGLVRKVQVEYTTTSGRRMNVLRHVKSLCLMSSQVNDEIVDDMDNLDDIDEMDELVEEVDSKNEGNLETVDQVSIFDDNNSQSVQHVVDLPGTVDPSFDGLHDPGGGNNSSINEADVLARDVRDIFLDGRIDNL